MMTLNDGRSELWQWDTGRKLTVDAECSQVHFSNKVFGRSIDVDVIDGVATIPDILLQTDKEITAWAFVGTAENGYTKISKTFKVNRRNKPADYVFTPPEQTTLSEIMDRLDDIESSQDPDAIKNAVEDYLKQNPADAPVQSVNGKTGKVNLSAIDVGAISQNDLQEATNKALAQAKESGEFDGAPGPQGETGATGADGKDGVIALTGASVGQIAKITSVDENGVPTAWEPVDMPSGGGGGDWEQLSNITLTEDVQIVNLFDESLSPYSELLVEIFPTSSTDEDKKLTSNVMMHIATKKTGQELAVGGSYWANGVRYNICNIKLSPRMFSLFANGNSSSAVFGAYVKQDSVFEVFEGLTIYANGYKYFGIGSKFNVWGLKK